VGPPLHSGQAVQGGGGALPRAEQPRGRVLDKNLVSQNNFFKDK